MRPNQQEPQPPRPDEQTNQNNPEQTPPTREEHPHQKQEQKREKRPQKPIKDDFDINPPSETVNKSLWALFALSVLLSIMIPWMGFVSFALGIFAVTAQFIHPINNIKKLINLDRQRRRDKRNKQNVKEHEKALRQELRQESVLKHAQEKEQRRQRHFIRVEKIRSRIDKINDARQKLIEGIQQRAPGYVDGMPWSEVSRIINENSTSRIDRLRKKSWARNALESIKEHDSDIRDLQIEENRESIKIQKETIKQAKKQSKDASGKFSKSAGQLKRSNDEITKLETQFESMDKNNYSKNSYNTAQKEFKAADKDLSSAKKTLSDIELAQRVVMGQINQNESQVRDLDDKIKKQKQMLGNSADPKAIEQDVQQMEEQKSALLAEINNLQEDFDGLTIRHSEQQASVNAKQEVFDNAKKVYDQQQEYKKAFDEAKKDGLDISSLATKIDRATQNYEEITKDSGQALSSFNQAKEVQSDAKNELAELKQDLKARKAERRKLKHQDDLETISIDFETTPTSINDSSFEANDEEKSRAKRARASRTEDSGGMEINHK